VKSCTNRNYSISYSNDKQFGMDITQFKFPMRVKHLQIEIMTNGPVVAMMKVTKHFETKYRGGRQSHILREFFLQEQFVGVYQKQNFFLLSSTWHAVRIIGWGQDSGVPYWLVANTWGKNWGMEGFFKILRGYNHLSIEKIVLAGHLSKISSSRMIEASKNILYICIFCLLRLCF
jgi:cathepsin B